MSLTRSKFEQLVDGLIERCRGPVLKALQDAGHGLIHFPVMGREAEMSAEPARLVEARGQLRVGRARNEAVAPELRVVAVSQHEGIDEPLVLVPPRRAANLQGLALYLRGRPRGSRSSGRRGREVR